MKRKLPLPFGYILLIAMVLGALMVARVYIPYLYWDDKEDLFFYKTIIPLMLDYLFWAFFAPLMYWVLQKNPLNKHTPLRIKLKHVGVGIGLAFMHELLTSVVYFGPLHWLNLYVLNGRRLHFIVAAIPPGALQRLIEYCFIMGIFVAYDYYQKYQSKEIELANMETELSQAQLNALKMQLHPHFLFNTLNTISSLMEENVEDAQKVVAKLGLLLRTMLDQKQRHTTTLQNELKYVKSYLDIEQTRFRDRLQIRYEIAPATTLAVVPSLVFQPLIENAIKHGFTHRTEGGIITVRSDLSTPQTLKLEVEDDGVGGNNIVKGIGLTNVQERLEQLYGSNFQFVIHSPSDVASGKGFLVKITLPFTKQE